MAARTAQNKGFDDWQTKAIRFRDLGLFTERSVQTPAVPDRGLEIMAKIKKAASFLLPVSHAAYQTTKEQIRRTSQHLSCNGTNALIAERTHPPTISES